MTRDSDQLLPATGRECAKRNEIEDVFAGYIERLNAGERISPWQIEKEHPELALEATHAGIVSQ